ncbi:hypothetical protein B0H16DRAFT_128926 [Mycena metata]|uniref:Uncharacterized protein n=1 Tax=Mycena metata TaxID=1033252 RepID=A0AAD7MVZ2_9AGAR|nr:hypothetical protein B0H16DRAFT_128926 [Mycena metata]
MADFQIGPCSFRWPNRPAYWSLDPEGIEALSTEEAERLGFPSFQLSTNIRGEYWDASVYAGLRQFHQAKGFDPDSQDVARHLGHPLYELCGDMNSPFTHVDNFYEAEETVEDTDTEDEWADAQSSLHEDSDCDEGSDTEDGVGEARTCVEPQASAPQVDQEPMDGRCNSINYETDLKPHPATDRAPGGGFIHSIFGALRHSLAVEVDSDNIDSDPISPFLV